MKISPMLDVGHSSVEIAQYLTNAISTEKRLTTTLISIYYSNPFRPVSYYEVSVN